MQNCAPSRCLIYQFKMKKQKIAEFFIFIVPAISLAWGNFLYLALPDESYTNKILGVYSLLAMAIIIANSYFSYRKVITLLICIIFLVLNILPFTENLNLVWYVKYLISIILVLLIQYKTVLTSIEIVRLKLFFVISTLLSLISPIILVELHLIVPIDRFVYYNTRYAGFGWELVEPTGAMFISLMFSYTISRKFFFIVSSLFIALNFWTGFPSSNTVPIFVILFLITFFINRFNYNSIVTSISILICSFWEIIAAVMIDFILGNMRFLFVTADQQRVFGRFEAAFSILDYEHIIFTLSDLRGIMGLNGLHGISTLGLTVLSLPLFLVFVGKISQFVIHKKDLSVTFVSLSLVTLFGTKTSLLLLLILMLVSNGSIDGRRKSLL